MKIKVIIIWSTLRPDKQGYQAILNDLQNLSEFFATSTAGAWENSETIFMENPSFAEISKVNKQKTDYTVTIFSGHGRYDLKSKQTIIANRHGYEIPIRSLIAPNSQRQLLIVDCCRKFPQEEVFSYFEGIGDVVDILAAYQIGRHKRFLTLKLKNRSLV